MSDKRFIFTEEELRFTLLDVIKAYKDCVEVYRMGESDARTQAIDDEMQAVKDSPQYRVKG